MSKGGKADEEKGDGFKAALLGDRELETEDVDVEGFGVITVRGLTRAEFVKFGKLGDDKGPLHVEAEAIALVALKPTFTVAEIKRWQKIASVGEIEVVAQAIQRLSGTEEGAGKEATKRFSEGSES